MRRPMAVGSIWSDGRDLRFSMTIGGSTIHTSGHDAEAKEEVRMGQETSSLLLSHHPACGRFGHHVVRIMGRDVCMGCLFVYPSALVTMLVLLFLAPVVHLSYLHIFALGCALFAIAVARRAFWTGLRNKMAHMTFRIVLGVSLGSVVIAVAMAPGLMVRVGLSLVVIGTWAAYQLYGWTAMVASCRRCPGYRDFPRCKEAPPDAHGPDPGSGR